MKPEIDELAEAIEALRRHRTACKDAGLEFYFLRASVAAANICLKGGCLSGPSPDESTRKADELQRTHSLLQAAVERLLHQREAAELNAEDLSLLVTRSSSVLQAAGSVAASAPPL